MADQPAPLTVEDALGIVQRALVDLHAYMAKAPHEVDPQVCMNYLNKCAEWVQRLPPVGGVAVKPTVDEAPRGKAN